MKNGDKDISESDSKLQAGPRRNWGARVIVLLFPLVKVSIKATDALYRESMDHCTKRFFFCQTLRSPEHTDLLHDLDKTKENRIVFPKNSHSEVS